MNYIIITFICSNNSSNFITTSNRSIVNTNYRNNWIRKFSLYSANIITFWFNNRVNYSWWWNCPTTISSNSSYIWWFCSSTYNMTICKITIINISRVSCNSSNTIRSCRNSSVSNSRIIYIIRIRLSIHSANIPIS